MQCFYAEYEKEIKANCSESILFFILNLINKRKKRKDGFQIMQCCWEQKPPPAIRSIIVLRFNIKALPDRSFHLLSRIWSGRRLRILAPSGGMNAQRRLVNFVLFHLDMN